MHSWGSELSFLESMCIKNNKRECVKRKMDKQLIALKEKEKKYHKKQTVLYRQQQELQVKIIEHEKELALKDRITFLNNIQIGKGMTLRREEAEDEEEEEEEDAKAIREYVFNMEDLFPLILTYLGPMEYLMFFKTDRACRAALTKRFDSWARNFLSHIKLELRPIIGLAGYLESMTNQLHSLLVQFQLVNHTEENSAVFVPRLLGLIQQTFVKYRPQSKLVYSALVGRKLSQGSERYAIFVEDERRNIVRLDKLNFLFPKGSYKEISRAVETRLSKKYGFDVIKESKQDAISFFRYQDLCDLKLVQATEKRNLSTTMSFFYVNLATNRFIYWKETTSNLVAPTYAEWETEWKGKYFYDEYECRRAVEREIGIYKKGEVPHKHYYSNFVPKYMDIAVLDELLANSYSTTVCK